MKKNGFTLLELVSCIVVCCFFLFFSLASWIQFKQKNEGLRIINDIKIAIRYAKIQAMSSKASLRISSENWSKGMRLASASETVMHQWSWDNTNWDVRWLGANGFNSIVISGTAIHAMSNGRFVITNKSNGDKTILVLNRLGRVRQL